MVFSYRFRIINHRNLRHLLHLQDHLGFHPGRLTTDHHLTMVPNSTADATLFHPIPASPAVKKKLKSTKNQTH